MLRVLLINPFFKGVYFQIGLQHPPLGLAYLASVLQQSGYNVNILDLNVERPALENLSWKEWDVAGISGDTSRHQIALEIAKRAKEAGKIVVMGGYHVTFMDKETLETAWVDYVVRGEGERPFLELLQCLQEKGDPSQIRGISLLKDGHYFCTPQSLLVENLDRMPLPARELLPMRKYRKNKMSGKSITTMVTSRGCPFNCNFCSSSHFAGTRWRARNPQKIVEEIEQIIQRFNYQAIAFMDDNFTLDPHRVIAFCQEIVRHNLDIIWWCFSRVDTIVRNEKMVEEMAKAGARMIFLGLESASNTILSSYKKGITTKTAAKAVEMLKKYGIKVWGSFIIGGLEESQESIRQTGDYARWLNPDIAQFSILTPFPGTALFQQARKEKFIATYDWNKYDGAHAVMNTKYLTRREIAVETIKSYLKFYGRWSRRKQVEDGLRSVLTSLLKA